VLQVCVNVFKYHLSMDVYPHCLTEWQQKREEVIITSIVESLLLFHLKYYNGLVLNEGEKE
jgi:hypothetical protein